MPQLSNIAAVVFDMDGVLIDSEYVYRDEIGRFFSANGIDLSVDTLNAQVGASHKDYLAFLEKWWERGKGEKVPGPELARKVDAFNRAEGPLDYAAILNPGVPETLSELKEQGYRLALASSSLIGNIRHVLDVCGLTDAFELIVSGGDFHESKPNPEIYLHTVAELGLEPEQCAAVEEALGAPICKNLFLCTHNKSGIYLLMLPGGKPFKTKYLSSQIGCSRLSFAGEDDMMQLLHIHPGSVSPMGLMNDGGLRVQLVIDRELLALREFGCHPCVNTATLRLGMKDFLERYLPAVSHEAAIVDLPSG